MTDIIGYYDTGYVVSVINRFGWSTSFASVYTYRLYKRNMYTDLTKASVVGNMYQLPTDIEIYLIKFNIKMVHFPMSALVGHVGD